MSEEAVKWALRLPVKGSLKALLFVLAHRANEYGDEIRPSVPEIVKEAGMGRASVVTAVKKAEEMGLISAIHERGKRTRYTLHLDATEPRESTM